MTVACSRPELFIAEALKVIAGKGRLRKALLRLVQENIASCPCRCCRTTSKRVSACMCTEVSEERLFCLCSIVKLHVAQNFTHAELLTLDHSR